jgi:LytS/YehU family sensor histidine kinase
VAFVLLHLLLATLVVRLAPFAAGLAAGLVDMRLEDLGDTAWFWRPFGPDFRSWLTPLQFFLPPYLLGLALIAAARFARDYHRESLRSASLAAAYAEARMAMLTAQLQPHFLFNAMHAISELIHESPERATAMLARLADFLRVAIESSQRQWVSVTTELAGVETYLAIQQVRFRDQLAITMQVDPAAAAFDMLPLLVQPLAENAVEHGRSALPRTLHVGIAVRMSDGRLQIDVHNDAPRLAAPLTPERFGVGLANVSARLAAAYGGDATLQVGPGEHGGTLARLSLPVRSA